MNRKCLFGSLVKPALNQVMLAFVLIVAANVEAQTIWSGPLITYSQPAPNPNVAANQDRLTPSVWLTRTNSGGLFNATTETIASTLSPADTEWAFGTLSNYTNLQFSPWLT